MRLDANFALRRGELDLEVELSVAADETLALVGPNGAGKSTCLHVIAGLLPPDRGFVRLGDSVLEDSARGVRVGMAQRSLGVVFQEHRLFPHLDVLDNVSFGLRARGMRSRPARALAQRWLERMGISEYALAMPARLSGGQAQRVALARALATEPRLLLLDEPLSAVDASSRLTLRRELRAHLTEFAGPRIVVAHDAIDAFALADRVAVLEGGRIVQTGTTAQICSRPRSRYVADLIGTNLLRGTLEGGELHLPSGGRLIVASDLRGEVIATVHPRAIALFRRRPDGSPRNVWLTHFTTVENAGDRVRVQLGDMVPLVAEVTLAAVADLGLGSGGEIWAAVKATEITIDPL